MTEQQRYSVRCTLPNASENINGVPFSADEDGSRVAKDVSLDSAYRFARIPGFEVDPPVEVGVLPAADHQPSDNTAGADNIGGTDTGGEADETDTGGSGESDGEGSNQPIKIDDMQVHEIQQLLKEHPSAWREVEAIEAKRNKPRKMVQEAIEAAKKESADNS